MDHPILSVVVTVYNTAAYLKKCLESISAQTFLGREIIIVNDGSTDNSEEICKKYCLSDPTARLISQPNGGASAARNTGLQAATGDYIHFVDSDDFLPHNAVYEELTKCVEEHRPDIVFSLYNGYREGVEKPIEEQPLYCSPAFFEGDVLMEVLEKEYEMTLTCPVNKLFKRTFLIENDLFFTVGLDHEEDEWLPRVIANAKTACFYNQYIYSVLVRRPGALSQVLNETIQARKARSKMKIATTGMEYMKQRVLAPRTLQAVAAYYWLYMISAVVNTYRLKDKKLKKKNYAYIKENKRFFKHYKLLRNRNWRLMGWMFLHLGVRFTATILAKRY